MRLRPARRSPAASVEQQPDHAEEQNARDRYSAGARGDDGQRACCQPAASLAAAPRRRRYCWRRGRSTSAEGRNHSLPNNHPRQGQHEQTSSCDAGRIRASRCRELTRTLIE